MLGWGLRMANLPLNVRPIPVRLLIHSIGYEEYEGEKSFGSSWLPNETIDYVLFQPKTEWALDSKNREVEIKGIIFLDAVETKPYKPLTVGSKIKFKDWDLVVMDCSPLYTFDPTIPHHYEVRVM